MVVVQETFFLHCFHVFLLSFPVPPLEEGLSFILSTVVAVASFSWVVREKEKEVLKVRDKVKVLPWLASA